MPIFVRFFTMLQPFISKKFNGQVWRMEIDESTDILCAEIRNVADKTVSFASIDLNTGETYFDSLTTGERWMAGLEAVHDGVLLLHHYQPGDMPVHKGITAIDIKTGRTIWENYNYAFDHLSANGPVVSDQRIQPRKLFLIDITNGQYLRKHDAIIDTEAPKSIFVPDLVPANTLHEVPEGVDIYGNIAQRYQYNNYRIVSLHALYGGHLRQHLFIFENDARKPVFEDLLNDGIQKMQPEAFVLYNDRLLWIKEKTEIKLLKL